MADIGRPTVIRNRSTPTNLRASRYFTGKTRDFLETLGDTVRLDEIINAHARIVLEFYDWLYKRQVELHFDNHE